MYLKFQMKSNQEEKNEYYTNLLKVYPLSFDWRR